MDINGLQEISRIVRGDVIRMLGEAQSGHPGGSLSCVDILTTLYFAEMDNQPGQNPTERDRCILSKGHAAPALYSVLARKGYFPVEELLTLRKFGSRLQGHPDMKKTPGVDASTGSLGQGSSIAVGLALGEKLKKGTHKIYAIVGDGEIQEGQFWEAMMSANHYKLDNLTIILDHNGLQIDGTNDAVMTLGNIRKKLEAFGAMVIEVDGHDHQALIEAYRTPVKEQFKFILAQTVKGKGVSFMENQVGWHGKAPNGAEVRQALIELGCSK
jgi:transketolase